MEERWAEVIETLDEKGSKIKFQLDIQRLCCETEAISRVLHSHEKWLDSSEASVADPKEPKELNRISDQSKVSFTRRCNLLFLYYVLNSSILFLIKAKRQIHVGAT